MASAALRSSDCVNPGIETRSMLAVLPVALFVASVVASSPTIYVDAEDLTPTLTDLLVQELGQGTVTATPAEAELHVEARARQMLRLRITARPDRLIADQTFPLIDGIKPALRAATLLIVDAAAAIPVSFPPAAPPRGPAAAPTARASAGRAGATNTDVDRGGPNPDAPSASSRLVPASPGPRESQASWPALVRLHALLTGSTWAEPGTAFTGFAVAGQVRAGPIYVGAQVGLQGVGCCRLSSEAVDGRVLVATGLIGLEWPAFQSGWLTGAVVGRLGGQWARFSGRAIFTPPDRTTVQTTEQSATAWGPLGQLGFAVDIRSLERLTIRVALGAEARGARLVVRPPVAAGSTEIVNGGLWAGWLQIGVGLDFF